MRVRLALVAVGVFTTAATLSGCATDPYVAQCEREREQNRAAMVAAGGALGALAGAAVSDDDAKGAVVGGAAGAALGGVLASQNNPCRDYYMRRYGTPY